MRILIASLVGGFLLFTAGAVCHMFLDLESRNIRPTKDESKFHEFLVEQDFPAGMYGYPAMPENASSLSPEEQTKIMSNVFARFKEGPAAYLIVLPKGQDAMGPTQLGGELIADIAAALFASVLVSCLSSSIGLGLRWILVVCLAPLSWFSLTFSYGLWYRFPWSFICDGLIVAIIEWSLAGIAIVMIVNRTAPSTTPVARD